jgi:hypothetical protein
MIIRPATLADYDAIFALGMEQAEQYDRLKVDHERTRKLLIEVISSPQHYAIVGLDENREVKAVLLAMVGANYWAQRQCATVGLWVSKIAGGGADLLRFFREWVRSRRAIKVAGLAPDLDLDPRILLLAERIGFKRHGGSYLLYN